MPDPNMSAAEFERWLRAVSEQDDQLRRARGMREAESVTERLNRLRAGLDDYRSGLGPIQAEQLRRAQQRGSGGRTWHDWRSPGLRNDCTRLDGHTGSCRRVRESVENRPLRSGADRYVIVVEAKVGAPV